MLNTSSSFETLGDLDGWLRSLEISTPWASVVRDKIKLVSSDRPGYSRKSGRLTAGTPSRRTARVTTFGRLCTADLDRLFPSFTTYYRVLSCPETLWGSLALIPATSFTQYGLRHVEQGPGSALPGLREDRAGDQALLVCSLQAGVVLRASSVTHQPNLTTDSGDYRLFSQSKECQTSNWKSHKAFCNGHVGANNSLQQLANATPGTVERETYEVEVRLKRWIEVRFCSASVDKCACLERLTGPTPFHQLYRGKVGTAAIHALTLQSTPEKVLTHLLVVTLSPNPAFWASNTARAISRCFHLSGLGVTTLEAVRKQVAQADEKVAEEQINGSFDTVLKQSQALREKGGAGSVITLIQVQGTRVLHITPFSFEESVDEELLPYDEQWDTRFVRAVENGIVNAEATDRPGLQHQHQQHDHHGHNPKRDNDHEEKRAV
jgi:hypothetical protein